jgi:RNA polymerase sigma-70 factor, ECF subfamily
MRSDRCNEFTELLTAQQGSLFAYIYALVHNLRDAEDVYQDVALTIWQKYDDFTVGTNFAAWAQTVARYKVRDFLRRKRRGRVHFNDRLLVEMAETLAESDASGNAETAQAYHRALHDCMSRLNAVDQQLVAMSYSRTCTLKEVAEREGRSLQSVCNSLKRIRSTLFDCITDSVDEDRR